MSMLCALSGDYEASERWYDELRQFALRCDKRDAEGRQAKSRLAWLDISLPQRGVEGLTETIPAGFPSHDGKRNRAAAVFRDEYPAQHYERRKRFF